MTLADPAQFEELSGTTETPVNERSTPRPIARQWLEPLILPAADALAISVAFYSSWYARYVLELGPEIEDFNFVPYSVYLPLQLWLVPILVFAFHFAGLYRSRRGLEWYDDIPAIVGSTALGVMILFTGAALLRYPASSRLTFILAWLLTAVLVAIGRGLVQFAMASIYSRGTGIRRVLIVGGNNLGRMIMQSLASKGHLGYRVVGFLDDHRDSDHGRYRFLGNLDDLGRVADLEQVDLVIIALPAASHAGILKIVDHCRRDGVHFKIVPDLYEMSLSQVDVGTVAGIPLIGLKEVSIQGVNAVIKRTVDVVLASFALLVAAPLMALLALLIRLESPGPVIYRHERIGKNRLPFTTYKFRSMRQDADQQWQQLVQKSEGDNRLFKRRDDPRITRVGLIMRRLSLDELPQFWNVLRGEMSIVGPRPQIPSEVANYEEEHFSRMTVSPGLTGLWQVNGRSELTFDEMMVYDVYYIQNWSLGLDVRIILHTIPAVLRGRGAF